MISICFISLIRYNLDKKHIASSQCSLFFPFLVPSISFSFLNLLPLPPCLYSFFYLPLFYLPFLSNMFFSDSHFPPNSLFIIFYFVALSSLITLFPINPSNANIQNNLTTNFVILTLLVSPLFTLP